MQLCEVFELVGRVRRRGRILRLDLAAVGRRLVLLVVGRRLVIGLLLLPAFLSSWCAIAAPAMIARRLVRRLKPIENSFPQRR